MLSPTASTGPGGLVARALAWNTAYRVFETIVTFAAMLVLVRIVAPADYGRFGAVLGILTFLNGFSFSMFVAYALQMPDDTEPDWSLHWSVGFYIQTALMLIGHLVAGLCWFSETYRPIALLLHLAAFGLVLDWPAHLNSAMLRRAMDFRRLKVIMACSLALKLTVTLAAALFGAGAYGLVLGANVASALPLSFDLLVIRRWRPANRWWRRPDRGGYGLALRFGGQQCASSLLFGARTSLEGLVLSAKLGFAAIGLLGRAQALFGMSIGRVASVLLESVYPVMPRLVSDRCAYAGLATLLAQIICWLAIPGAAYMAFHGPVISRTLYGDTWVAADPVILPAVVAGLGMVVSTVAVQILLAANRLRLCLGLDMTSAALGLVPLLAVWAGGEMTSYAWTLAGVQITMAVLSLVLASAYFTVGWFRTVLVPPAVSSVLAVAAVAAFEDRIALEVSSTTLMLGLPIYIAVVIITFRIFFAAALGDVVSRLPGGRLTSLWLRLTAVRSGDSSQERV